MGNKYAEWKAKTGARLAYRELVAKYHHVPDVAELTQLSIVAYGRKDKRELRRIHDRVCQNIIKHMVSVEGKGKDDGVRALFALEYAFSEMMGLEK